MNITMRKTLCSVLLVFGMAQTSLAEGDAVKGQTVFSRCSPCHYADAATNRMGPYLLGISGRKAGGLDDYQGYSQAMKDAGAQGMVWDDATLARFLASPKKTVPGTSMRFFGLWSEQEIADVIAYLKSQQPTE